MAGKRLTQPRPIIQTPALPGEPKPWSYADARAENARRSLRAYVEEAWPIVEPGAVFTPGWHIDAACEHLEAVTAGQIRQLIINQPPRTTKSTIVCVMWQTWEWITFPHTRWMFGSYAESLSIRDSIRCRRILQSAWYQGNWGPGSFWSIHNSEKVFHLVGDQNEKRKFENDRTGYRIATSVGGGLGEGANRLVLDDPNRTDVNESDLVRNSTNEWFDNTWSTRLNDPKRDSKVIIMQRLHEDDVTGHALKQGGWEHLELPMEYDGRDLIAA